MTRTCENPACSNELDPYGKNPARFARQKYCSLSCASVVRNSGRRAPVRSKTCQVCGETFVRDSAKDNNAAWEKRKFCSRTCMGVSQRRPGGEAAKPKRRRPVKRRPVDPDRSVFGDAPQVEPWRPSAWRSAS